VRELAAQFIPVADEVYRLQTGTDAECRLFQKFAEQGHYGGRPGTTRQGTYAATPSGELLASVNSNDPERIADLLRDALARWQKLGRDDRLLPNDPKSQASALRRAERAYPEGGLVLHVYSRDLPRADVAPGWRGKAWNQDYAWFQSPEAKQFLPPELRVGQKHELPAPLIRRLARAHLVDNVRGQTMPYDEKHIEKARLTTEVTAVNGDLVSLRLEGETRAAAEGTWSVSGQRGRRNITPQKRGFETRLLGQATYDVKQERFRSFELVAVGTRWGGTQFNVRRDDLAPAPMGVLFTLAGANPWERVAPAFFRDVYAWTEGNRP
jgi:hypothetical protein